MTAPGWYAAEGDPPGSTRYWDGSQWVGDPVFEPAGAPVGGVPAPGQPVGSAPSGGGYHYAGQSAVARFPGSLKALAIIVSVLKAIPLVLGIIGVLFLNSFTNEIDEAFQNDPEFRDSGIDFEGFFDAAFGVIIVFIVIGAIMLGIQFWGALKERPMMLGIIAVILSILDVILMLGSWASAGDADGPVGAVIMTAVTIAQVTIAVKAFKANK